MFDVAEVDSFFNLFGISTTRPSQAFDVNTARQHPKSVDHEYLLIAVQVRLELSK